MRVHVTAKRSSFGNAVGQVELECTGAGLVVGLAGVGAYSDGYAPGALALGTRLVVPWSAVRLARASEEEFDLAFDAPGFPHDRLTLTRFRAGPGVPWTELRKRRLLLHFGALSLAAAAAGVAAVLAPRVDAEGFGWGALGYGFVAASIVLALGYSLGTSWFLAPPSEAATREAFLGDFARHFPELERVGEIPRPAKPFEMPNLAGFLPRTAIVIGITFAAAVLTALVTGRRLLGSEAEMARRSLDETSEDDVERVFVAGEEGPDDRPLERARTAPPTPTNPDVAATDPARAEPTIAGPDEESAPSGDGVTIERRCLCDRADSPLWQKPIPRLTTLLLDRRLIPTKTSARTEIEVAVVNNGDAPLDEITLQVQFYEMRGKERVPTKNRPLYFEGPLAPGAAIKWSTDARGTDFEITSPDVGALGPNGEGAATREAFFELLSARNRPVRLHAVRMLGYLGDERARDAALQLKDALRSAEAPYLRRVLAALHEVRTCDVESKRTPNGAELGACVFNASDAKVESIGLQVQALEHAIDVTQPLANPPELRAEKKWTIPGALDAQAGQYVRVVLPASIAADTGATLEVLADRFDLLE